jgi:IS1 family transposase
VQRFQCLRCSTTFSETQPLEHLRVKTESAVQVINLLVEGVGIRAISRLTRLDQETVLNILEVAGGKCSTLLDTKIRDVECESVQCDELYAFVYSKRSDDPEQGPQFTYLAIDRKSKMILSHLVGKRDRSFSDEFMLDLRKRVKGRCQLTTDGYTGYIQSVYNAFDGNVDFAQQIKVYHGESLDPRRDERRYAAPRGVKRVTTHIHSGNPNRELISTSHVERTNLSVRLFNRRFTRLTLGFSKKLRNLKHSTALFIAHFNFCRVHSVHNQTPAQAAGLTDKAWNVEDLIFK